MRNVIHNFFTEVYFKLKCTFSNFNLIGLGFTAVTSSTISFPTANARSFEAPFNSTNKLNYKIH